MAFLVFEGLDGSGKSSLIERVKSSLEARGLSVVTTREPGGTPLGEELRQALLRVSKNPPGPRAELLLYQASRAQHVDDVIVPALKRGAWVLCDRFAASSVAFQSAGRGLPVEDVEALNSYAIQGCTPDLTVLLDLDVQESQARVSSRVKNTGESKDRFELEAEAFHQRVRASFLDQAKRNAGSKHWLTIDSSLSREIVFQKTWAELERLKWL